jgi:hypothetical protein
MSDCENVRVFFQYKRRRLTGERTFSFLPHRTRSRLVELLAHMQEAPFTKVHWLIYILTKRLHNTTRHRFRG